MFLTKKKMLHNETAYLNYSFYISFILSSVLEFGVNSFIIWIIDSDFGLRIHQSSSLRIKRVLLSLSFPLFHKRSLNEYA